MDYDEGFVAPVQIRRDYNTWLVGLVRLLWAAAPIGDEVLKDVCPHQGQPASPWAGQPSLRANQPSLKALQLGLGLGKPGLKPASQGSGPVSAQGQSARFQIQPARTQVQPAIWMDRRTDRRTDRRMGRWMCGLREFLPSLHDFVSYWGRCPAFQRII